jgi:hypothetical protein
MNSKVLALVMPLVLAGLSSCATSEPPVTVPRAKVITLSACVSVDGRADKRCTPGLTNPAVYQDTIRSTICTAGWTEKVRPPTTYTTPLKVYQMYLYGNTASATPPASVVDQYKEDHLIALELGGATRNPLNLWPQDNRSAKTKNDHANRLRTEVCAGRLLLRDAQDQLVARWTQVPTT